MKKHCTWNTMISTSRRVVLTIVHVLSLEDNKTAITAACTLT